MSKRKLPLLAALLMTGALIAALTISTASNAIPGNTLLWTGQGTTGGGLNSTLCDVSADTSGLPFPSGADENNYLQWNFTVGSGNTVTSATLTTNGDTTTWSTDASTTESGNVIKFITKSYDLTTLTASVSWVGDLGNGNAQLTISHGCVGGKSSPGIVTNPGPGGHTGDTLNDTATLSDGSTSPAIGGTITFKLFPPSDLTCGGAPVYTDVVTVDSGNGTYGTLSQGDNPGGFLSVVSGSYNWTADYSGDVNNNAVSSGCGLETFTAAAGASTVLTDIKVGATTVTEVTLGSVVHDHATVSSDNPNFVPPEGTVSFNFYTGTAAAPCSGTPVTQTPAVGLVGGAADSADSVPLAAGTYGYKVSYTSSDLNKWTSGIGDCEPLTVDKKQLGITTQIHNAAHNAVGGNTHVPLGSVVHDTATVTGAVQGFAIGAVGFTLNGSTVANDPAADGTATARSVDSAPLNAGGYTYAASVADNSNYIGATSADEPLTVDKGTLTLTTAIHDSLHNVVTSVPVNGIVHDTSAFSSGVVTGFPPTLGNVSFTFWTNDSCTGTGASAGNNSGVVDAVTHGARSDDSLPLASGGYSYKASFSGDTNYNPVLVANVACESLHVRTFGKTMGYWGNANGIKQICGGTVTSVTCTAGYLAHAVTIGRGGVIDTQAESQKVLPSTLNACGKGNPLIFTGAGGETTTANCQVNTGINTNSLNTLAAQTLALGYNLDPVLRPGFAGQHIGDLGCSTTGTTLLATNTVDQAFAAAVALINGSYGGATTQAQVGAMNTLLGCINAEA